MSTVWLNGMEENPLSFLWRVFQWTEDNRVAVVASEVERNNGQNGDGTGFTIAQAIAVVEGLDVTVLGHVTNQSKNVLWLGNPDPNRRYTVVMRSCVQFEATATVTLRGDQVIEFVQDLESSGWWFCHDVS